MTLATICGTRGSTTAGMARTLASTAACRRAKSARMESRQADSNMAKPVVLVMNTAATSKPADSGRRQSDPSQAKKRHTDHPAGISRLPRNYMPGYPAYRGAPSYFSARKERRRGGAKAAEAEAPTTRYFGLSSHAERSAICHASASIRRNAMMVFFAPRTVV